MMEFIRDVWQHLTKPDQLELWVTGMGPWLYVILFAVVFCETGLVVTPVLPGDSMLFAVGVVTVTSGLSLPATLAVLIAAAVLGDAVNYFIGYYVGPAAKVEWRAIVGARNWGTIRSATRRTWVHRI